MSIEKHIIMDTIEAEGISISIDYPNLHKYSINALPSSLTFPEIVITSVSVPLWYGSRIVGEVCISEHPFYTLFYD